LVILVLYTSRIEISWRDDRKLIVEKVHEATDEKHDERTHVRVTHKELTPLVEILEVHFSFVARKQHEIVGKETPEEVLSALYTTMLSAIPELVFSKEYMKKIRAWALVRKKLGKMKTVFMDINTMHAKLRVRISFVEDSFSIDCSDDDLKALTQELCRKILKDSNISEFRVLEVFLYLYEICTTPKSLRKFLFPLSKFVMK